MDKTIKFVGVDISKDSFNVHCFSLGDLVFKNDIIGFKSFVKQICNSSWIVMESTGVYHLRLAMFLFDNGITCSVVNPLSVKRFGQMKLKRDKTDKSDAKMIAMFSVSQHPKPWKPDKQYIQSCKQIDSTIELYVKQCTMIKNKLHNINNQAVACKLIINSLKKELKSKQREIRRLEELLESQIKENAHELLTHLTSIPGVGKRTAVQLIVVTNGFTTSQTSGQLISYLGLSPTTYSSGTSVRGSSSISKKGNRRTRSLLFMCSFTASIHNAQCKKLYDRLITKGKSKKLALIAVCNKLVKQCFAIATSGIPYDQNYKSKLTTST